MALAAVALLVVLPWSDPMAPEEDSAGIDSAVSTGAPSAASPQAIPAEPRGVAFPSGPIAWHIDLEIEPAGETASGLAIDTILEGAGDAGIARLHVTSANRPGAATGGADALADSFRDRALDFRLESDGALDPLPGALGSETERVRRLRSLTRLHIPAKLPPEREAAWTFPLDPADSISSVCFHGSPGGGPGAAFDLNAVWTTLESDLNESSGQRALTLRLFDPDAWSSDEPGMPSATILYAGAFVLGEDGLAIAGHVEFTLEPAAECLSKMGVEIRASIVRRSEGASRFLPRLARLVEGLRSEMMARPRRSDPVAIAEPPSGTLDRFAFRNVDDLMARLTTIGEHQRDSNMKESEYERFLQDLGAWARSDPGLRGLLYDAARLSSDETAARMAILAIGAVQIPESRMFLLDLVEDAAMPGERRAFAMTAVFTDPKNAMYCAAGKLYPCTFPTPDHEAIERTLEISHRTDLPPSVLRQAIYAISVSQRIHGPGLDNTASERLREIFGTSSDVGDRIEILGCLGLFPSVPNAEFLAAVYLDQPDTELGRKALQAIDARPVRDPELLSRLNELLLSLASSAPDRTNRLLMLQRVVPVEPVADRLFALVRKDLLADPGPGDPMRLFGMQGLLVVLQGFLRRPSLDLQIRTLLDDVERTYPMSDSLREYLDRLRRRLDK